MDTMKTFSRIELGNLESPPEIKLGHWESQPEFAKAKKARSLSG